MRRGSAKVFHVYILASRPRGVLYVGMTSELPDRAWEHRERVLDGFTKRYWVNRLVYFERHDEADAAARRERAFKTMATRLEDRADREAQSDLARFASRRAAR